MEVRIAAPSDPTAPAVGVLGTYPPRACGIATFTRDLCRALAVRSGRAPAVAAVDEPGAGRAYAPEVRWRLAQEDAGGYRRLAGQLNGAADVVCVQHEYGLYGRERGVLLLELLDRLDVPVVLTLHTVLGDPDPELAALTRKLCDRSTTVVVLARQATRLLRDRYGVEGGKIRFVPHGVPALTHHGDGPARAAARARLGVAGRTVLTTFGLLGPNKGVEHALHALPAVTATHPGVLYAVLGATHPGERRGAGESYRHGLQRTAAALGLARHVRFVDRYLAQPELLAWLDATDVCVLPYREPEQISSGTLAYALAAGKPVVATEFRSARELLSTGGGVLVALDDPAALADALLGLLADHQARQRIARRARTLSRPMRWEPVAAAYHRLFAEAVARRDGVPRDRPAANRSSTEHLRGDRSCSGSSPG